MMYINKIKNLLSQQTWSESDVCYAMVNFRSLLEKKRIKEKYPILNLYCNWSLHPLIQESKVAFRILEYITDSLVSYGVGEYSEGRFSDAVIEGFQMHTLFEELIKLGKEYDLAETEVFCNENRKWAFASQLLLILLGKPIRITSKSVKKKDLLKIAANIYKRGETGGNPAKYAVIGCGFIVYENKVHWKIETKFSVDTGINLIGKFILTTREEIEKLHRCSKN